LSTKTPQAILRLCEKIKVATQLPSLKFVEPDTPHVISVSPVTYPVTTLIKIHDRKVGVFGYREIYGQEIAVVLCFHVIPFTIDADPKSLDKFASWVVDYLKAVDVALRLEQVGIPYAEHLYRSFGVKPIGSISTTTDTVFYINSSTDYDNVPAGGYFSIVGYSEPVVKVYRRIAKRYPYDRELVGTIKPDEPLPDWLKEIALEAYLKGGKGHDG
jgi:hypothetical protein